MVRSEDVPLMVELPFSSAKQSSAPSLARSTRRKGRSEAHMASKTAREMACGSAAPSLSAVPSLAPSPSFSAIASFLTLFSSLH